MLKVKKVYCSVCVCVVYQVYQVYQGLLFQNAQEQLNIYVFLFKHLWKNRSD